MIYGFQISDEDIIVACSNLGHTCTYELASQIMSKLDLDKVQNDALQADGIDAQTIYAIDSIEKQIIEQKLLN
jgi:hypothetical protein